VTGVSEIFVKQPAKGPHIITFVFDDVKFMA